jgi:hypothetical protein
MDASLLHVHRLFAHLLDADFSVHHVLAHSVVLRFVAQGVDLAVKLLENEVEFFTARAAGGQNFLHMLEMITETNELFFDIGAIQEEREFLRKS